MIITHGRVFQNGTFQTKDLIIEDGKIAEVAKDTTCFDASDCLVLPGLQDAHVHLREPGFAYKETIKEGSMSAARGGYTMIAPMPNLNPVPDSLEHLQEELHIIERDACMDVLPYASITKGEEGKELCAMEEVAPYVIGYSDDGKGVNDLEVLKASMVKAKKLDKPIVLHCEELALVNGGYVANTPHLLAKGYKGICPESEAEPVKKAIMLAKETGAHVHICHISCRETIEAVRAGKRDGVQVTCEVTPHHLLLNDFDIQDDGNYKMNPPIRSEEDRLALIAAVNDGTIDLIATDNAPHSVEEKKQGLAKSPFGIITNEYAFALLYTHLVQKNLMSLETLVTKMTSALKVLSGKDLKLVSGERANICIIKLGVNSTIRELHSKSQNSPFVGWHVDAENICTIYDGKCIYKKEEF